MGKCQSECNAMDVMWRMWIDDERAGQPLIAKHTDEQTQCQDTFANPYSNPITCSLITNILRPQIALARKKTYKCKHVCVCLRVYVCVCVCVYPLYSQPLLFCLWFSITQGVGVPEAVSVCACVSPVCVCVCAFGNR